MLHAEGDGDGNSNIKGTIVTNEGLPAVGVTVTLKGTKRNTITDDDGNFHFKNPCRRLFCRSLFDRI